MQWVLEKIARVTQLLNVRSGLSVDYEVGSKITITTTISTVEISQLVDESFLGVAV